MSGRCSAVKKGAHKNLANFVGKKLCLSLFFMKLQAFRLATLLKRDSKNLLIFEKTYCEEHLQTTASKMYKQYL